MDNAYDDEKDAVVTEAENQDSNVRALSDDEVAAYRNEEIEKLGNGDNVRAVTDEELAALREAEEADRGQVADAVQGRKDAEEDIETAEKGADEQIALDQTDDFRNPR
jgi:hypothetical protein